MRICSQPRRHPHRNSIQVHGLELMSLSVLCEFPELRVLLQTLILHAAALYMGPVSTRVLSAHCPNSLQGPS